MSLTSEQLTAVEAALTGPRGEELMRLMRRLTTGGRPKHDFSEDTIAEARRLGWIDRMSFPTELGWKMGDPIREFMFWNERDRTVHEWKKLPVMQPEYFENKRLLSIGCGCGTNLFTFQSMCSSVVGVEIEPTYLQFTPLWARLAGVEVPRTIASGAERMPLPDADFDVVVCFGALQYMRIQEVLKEIARVMRDDAICILTLSNFTGYVTELFTRARTFRRPQEVLREAAIFANMLAYPWVGRVIVRSYDPVYPTFERMRGWLADVGLELDDHLTRGFRHEICYVARKRIL